MAILTSTWTVSKDLMKKKLPARKYFYSSTKDGKVDDDGKISDGHISVKDYLTCEKSDKFKMTIWVIITIIIWKNMYCYQ